MKILIVGGVAGGATAIARLRRLDEKAEIILFERGSYVSYANCGLPYYIGGIISERDMLFVTSKEEIEAKYGVEIRTESNVLEIDRENKKIKVSNDKTGEIYYENYDKLLLSTGSSPFVPNLPGIDSKGVFKLWTVNDTDNIYEYIKNEKPKKAVIAGGGFIGLEMAENLVERGIEVTLVDLAMQVMPPIDKEMAKIVENHLVLNGVKLHLGKGLEKIEDNGKTAVLNSGEKIDTDLIIMSIGVKPNNKLAKDANLDLTERGGIKVDEFMMTSDEDIYAVGDVIGVNDFVLKNETMIPLAGPANKQGRAVAANILGQEKEDYKGTMGTSVAQIFDLTVASTGASEKTLNRQGKKYKEDYLVTIIHPMSHAGYYPGAFPMTLKLMFSTDGKVLGAQIVGYKGVDKRIDTIATTIYLGGTVFDLKNLELAYAPPYSSAKDPVNYAGYTAENILRGVTETVRYEEWKENQDEYTFLDIRENDEILTGKIPGAVHIPLTELRERHNELDRDKTYLTFCAVGLRGYVAERILKQKGFNVKNLLGGFRIMQEMESQPELESTISQGSHPETGSDISNSSQAASDADLPEKIELLNVCGLSCPGPIVQVAKKMQEVDDGTILIVSATDPGFFKDIESWCINTDNLLLDRARKKGEFVARIQKGNLQALTNQGTTINQVATLNQKPALKEKTMIIFDGDLDKAIASFIIATGAAAMGNKVNMFFTFWGLAVIRKNENVPVKKDFMSKMFGTMVPRGSEKLKLSQMNFMGAGAKMIRGVMKKQGVTSLEDLIKQAIDAGVKMTACQMSMDVMGIKKEELLDGVEIGGVATMLNDSDNSNMNLFI